MPIAVYIHPESMSAAQYDDIHRRLDKAGQASPKGRLHHSCFGPADHLMVYDVWESQEDFEAFGKALGPILEEVGMKAGQPDVMPIHDLA
jgi:hypothetical protein